MGVFSKRAPVLRWAIAKEKLQGMGVSSKARAAVGWVIAKEKTLGIPAYRVSFVRDHPPFRAGGCSRRGCVRRRDHPPFRAGGRSRRGLREAPRLGRALRHRQQEYENRKLKPKGIVPSPRAGCRLCRHAHTKHLLFVITALRAGVLGGLATGRAVARARRSRIRQQRKNQEPRRRDRSGSSARARSTFLASLASLAVEKIDFAGDSATHSELAALLADRGRILLRARTRGRVRAALAGSPAKKEPRAGARVIARDRARELGSRPWRSRRLGG